MNVYESYDEAIKIIRKAIKSLTPTVSVRRGRGTAYSWIDIHGSADEFGHFTDTEKQGLAIFGITCGGNLALISPESRGWAYNRAMEVLRVCEEVNDENES